MKQITLNTKTVERINSMLAKMPAGSVLLPENVIAQEKEDYTHIWGMLCGSILRKYAETTGAEKIDFCKLEQKYKHMFIGNSRSRFFLLNGNLCWNNSGKIEYKDTANITEIVLPIYPFGANGCEESDMDSFAFISGFNIGILN